MEWTFDPIFISVLVGVVIVVVCCLIIFAITKYIDNLYINSVDNIHKEDQQTPPDLRSFLGWYYDPDSKQDIVDDGIQIPAVKKRAEVAPLKTSKAKVMKNKLKRARKNGKEDKK